MPLEAAEVEAIIDRKLRGSDLSILVRQLQGKIPVKQFYGPYSAAFVNVASGGSATVTHAHNLNLDTAKTLVLGEMVTTGFGEKLSRAFAVDSANQLRILAGNNSGGLASGTYTYFIVELN